MPTPPIGPLLPPSNNPFNNGIGPRQSVPGPLLPPWIPPRQGGGSRRRDINATNTPMSRRQASVSAEGTIIPIIYGTDSIGPIISLVHAAGGYLYLRCVWCLGEISAVQSITLDGNPLPAGIEVTHYTGTTSQVVDPTLAAVVPGYADTCILNVAGQLVGVAYSVFKIPANSSQGFPRIVAKIAGKKIWDPRVPGFVYSSNPALILADLLTNTIQGLGLTVDFATTVTAAANWADEIISGSTVARHECNITLASRQEINTWIETVRAYARVFIVWRDGVLRFIKDAASTSVGTITQADMVQGSFNIEKRSMLNLPNVVKVFYTSASTDPPTEDVVEVVKNEVLLGTEFRRETVLRMPGYRYKQQALRFAIERLNDANLIDLNGVFDVFDTQWKYEVGDVIEISHPIGLTLKKVRILSIDPIERGILRINFVEYDVNVYSEMVVDEPPPPDSGGQSAIVPPPITGLVLTEEFYVRGITVGSQLAISWNNANYSYLQYYVVDVFENGVKILTARTPDLFYKVRDVAPGVMYSVKVYALSVAFIAGPVSTANLIALGYLIPPDFSQGQIVVFEAQDALYGSIVKPAIDIDLWGYEWRYSEILDINHFPAGGPDWDVGGWTGNTGDCTFTFRNMYMAISGASGGPPYSRSITSAVVLTLGKKYDIYVKVKNMMNNTTATSFQGGVILTFPVSGKNTILFFHSNSTTARKGVFVTRGIAMEEATVDVTILLQIFDLTTKTMNIELEYISFRESEENCTSDWNNSTLIERSAANSVNVRNLVSSEYVMYCRALDSVRTPLNVYGQYSSQTKLNWATVLNEDSIFARDYYRVKWGAFPTNYETVPSFNENEFSYISDGVNGGTVLSSWLVPTTAITWNARFTGTIDSNTLPIFYYFENASGSKTLYTESVYLEIPTYGVAHFECESRVLGNTGILSNPSIETSIGGGATTTSPMTSHTSPTPFYGDSIWFQSTGASNLKQIFNFNSHSKLKINRNSRVESGSVTTNAADGSSNPVPKKVILQTKFLKVLELRAWPNTQEPYTVHVDNITFLAAETSFTIVALNLRGLPVAVSVSWFWRGV